MEHDWRAAAEMSEKRKLLVEKLTEEKAKYMKHNSDWTDSYQKLVLETANKEIRMSLEVQELKSVIEVEKTKRLTLN